MRQYKYELAIMEHFTHHFYSQHLCPSSELVLAPNFLFLFCLLILLRSAALALSMLPCLAMALRSHTPLRSTSFTAGHQLSTSRLSRITMLSQGLQTEKDNYGNKNTF